ncbi:glycosyltransferase family 4 protein [Xanthobacter sp. V4C-4]|uniref:glycosyltransferase family 4 protein n=1 Tax=Xanthobacter cornucopiae TaxID=3119924 RepID=UPI00372A2FE1
MTRAGATGAAIFYHPEAYTTSGPKLMGRNAAGQSFLDGFLAHARGSGACALVDATAHADPFRAAVAASGRAGPVTVLDRTGLPGLERAGTLFYPGPDIEAHARRRAAFGATRWSLTGVTHTTASAGVMDVFTGLVAGNVQPWDAIILTSTAVRDQVAWMLAAEEERLARRFGPFRWTQPQMPVIPLGLNSAAFASDAAARAAARARLGVGPDAIVVLFIGRLAYHAKAHPLAMYQALQAAARGDGARHEVVLVECGWFANDHIAAAFAAASGQACPDVRVVRLDGRDAEARGTAWAGADVFCSLSDNIQETFGLTPIEAMAAGLPVVVSDWDGYRDTVRDGVDGFRVPTLMPVAGLGGDLALRHGLGLDTYDLYCGLTCALVAVDVDATTQAFRQLFGSAELRRRMGEAGRQRAREVFDWAAVIPRYEALWDELAELRRAAAAQPQPRPRWPGRPDPFAAFAGYSTHHLGPDTVLELGAPDLDTALARAAELRALAMVDYARVVLPADADVAVVLGAAAAGPAPAHALVAAVPADRRTRALRGLGALAKLGLLRLPR